jgi:hypothetical protein
MLPALVTGKDLEKLLQLSQGRISQLNKSGVLKPAKGSKVGKGTFELLPSVHGYLATLRANDTPSPFNEARTVLTSTRAAIAELDLQARQAQLVSVEEIEAGWGQLMDALKGHLLSMPTKIAARLSSCRTTVEAQALLRREIHDALGRISTHQFAPKAAAE